MNQAKCLILDLDKLLPSLHPLQSFDNPRIREVIFLMLHSIFRIPNLLDGLRVDLDLARSWSSHTVVVLQYARNIISRDSGSKKQPKSLSIFNGLRGPLALVRCHCMSRVSYEDGAADSVCR